MSIAIRQIERQPGKQNNLMQLSTAITNDKVLRDFMTFIVAANIILSSRNTETVTVRFELPLSMPTLTMP